MKELRDVSIDDVRGLVAERQRFDDWLAVLEAKRAETPERVFARVYADYAARRDEVIAQLGGHVAGLAALGEELTARLAAIDDELAAHEDTRAEAMLRTAVGEYDGDRWEQVRLEVESSIAGLEDQRTAVAAEIADVRVLLARAASEPADGQSREGPSVEGELGNGALADVEREGPETASEAPTPDFDQARPGTDETAEESIAEVGTAASPFARPDVATTASSPFDGDVAREARFDREPVEPEDLDGADFDEALALFSSVPPVPNNETLLPGRSVDLTDELTLAADGEARARSPFEAPAPAPGSAEPDSSRDTFDDLAFLRSVIDPSATSGTGRTASANDQQKTLRCTECGTMNFPTEWYCERCGGELAAF